MSAELSGRLAESEALHDRVGAFVAERNESAQDFERLAVDIGRFQLRYQAGFARLVAENAGAIDSLDSIPAIPVEAFRLARIATHPAEEDVVRFRSSGTTASMRSIHSLRTTRSYARIALAGGRPALWRNGWPARGVVVALAAPGSAKESSLSFMMRELMAGLDGRALTRDPTGVPFDVESSERWLASNVGIDVPGLRRAALVAQERQEPFVVLATSFALVLLLDALAGASVPAPKRTLVMQTGGFKGRTREVPKAELRAAVARAFRVAESQVISEYGMTELTSQLWEPAHTDGKTERFVAPPWLRVDAVDPVTLATLRPGQVGLARFVDLGNVDTAISIVTQDLVRCSADGVELLGRAAGAPLRGCSLSVEEFVGAARASTLALSPSPPPVSVRPGESR